MKHGKWSVMAVCGAVLVAAPLMAEEQSVGASLFGENEVGHEGAGEDAGGDFSGFIDTEAGTLCYYLETYGLDTVTAAHLHKGRDGTNGDPVVVLKSDEEDEVCVEVEAEVLADIARREQSYYVNVHTEAFPAGAIRGQLGS